MYLSIGNMDEAFKAIKAIKENRTTQHKYYVTDGNIIYLTDASRFLISCVIQHYAPVVG